MKLLFINTVFKGSTGKVIKNIVDTAIVRGDECFIAVPKGRHNRIDNPNEKNVIWIGNQIAEDLHLLLGRITGLQGYFSYFATKKFLKEVDRINPDIIHLHNLHNCYINLPLLFKYIKRKEKKVVWTLHDCWAFTGKCPHFQIAKCEKWKKGCEKCSHYKEYPQMWIDSSKTMWKRKKKLFTGISNMTIVTPSKWLSELVHQSFLKEYPIKMVNNGIDLNIFKPISSEFKTKEGIKGIMLLGVASDWGKGKGLDVFCRLAKHIDQQKYSIVLVGTNDKIDKTLPSNIISIHKTQNEKELVEIYSSADVFINPTREDNYPTVNMESIACGTPVITFNTGGSPEMILNDECGCVIDTEDVTEIIDILEKFLSEKKYDCYKFAKKFDKDIKSKEYLRIYEEMI